MMGPRRPVLLVSILLLLTAACLAADLTRFRPTETPIPLPSRTPTATATHTPTPSPLPPTVTSAPLPAWVADFSNPILAALANRQPDFRDDFSAFRGWYHPAPAAGSVPYRADVAGGVLSLKLPRGLERSDLAVFNARLVRADFVLSFDLKFGKTEPADVVRLQVEETADRSVFLDLSRNESWSLAWSLHTARESRQGTYAYFSPESIRVAFIVRAEECAVIVNQDPLVYSSRCRSGSLVRSSPMAVSFHLLTTAGEQAMVTIDNVMLWDLEDVP